jgi:hypothetical protein
MFCILLHKRWKRENIYLVSSRTSNKTLPTTPSKQNGTIRPQQSKNKKVVVSPSSNDSSYSPTTMDEKNNNSISQRKSNKTSPVKKERRNSVDLDDTPQNTINKKHPIGKNSMRYIKRRIYRLFCILIDKI